MRIEITQVKLALLAGFLFSLNGCTFAPSIHHAVKVLYPMPAGTSDEEIRKMVFGVYSSHARHDWVFVQPPHLMTKEMIEGEKKFLVEWNKLNLFTCVYPPDLFEKMPTVVFVDGTGYFKEGRFEQHSSLDIFFDSKTNYIGFAATSGERAR